MTLQEISKKYGEYIFRLAVTHLFSVGINKMREIDIEDAARVCMKETADNSIMTPEFRANVLRCAYDLSQVPLWDVLKFMQSDIKIDNQTVHANVYVRFVDEKTGKTIADLSLPAETTECDVDMITNSIEKARADHKALHHGGDSGFNIRNAIFDAIRKEGITATPFMYDHTVFI